MNIIFFHVGEFAWLTSGIQVTAHLVYYQKIYFVWLLLSMSVHYQFMKAVFTSYFFPCNFHNVNNYIANYQCYFWEWCYLLLLSCLLYGLHCHLGLHNTIYHDTQLLQWDDRYLDEQDVQNLLWSHNTEQNHSLYLPNKAFLNLSHMINLKYKKNNILFI